MGVDDIRYQDAFGKFQIFLILFIITIAIPTVFDLEETVFQGGTPNYWCPPPGLDPNITVSLNHSQLLTLSAPLNQRSGQQCDIIDRNYTSLTLKDVYDILLENQHYNKTNSLKTKKCSYWQYYSTAYGQTNINEVSRMSFCLNVYRASTLLFRYLIHAIYIIIAAINITF